MKVVGIIAEYNPFHNGHLYQIKYAKEELHADAVIVVMSGDFVQRGEPAILDKYTRCDMALKNGVDLVLQMPVVASTASAELFAQTGIGMLLSTGVVTDIIFGCEEANRELFVEIAKILLEESPGFKEVLSESLKSGASFAKARADAVCSVYKGQASKEKLEKFLNGANNILGIEYTKALLLSKKDVLLHPLKRMGIGHDSLESTAQYASATLLRKSMMTKKDVSYMVSPYIPANCLEQVVELVEDNHFLGADDLSILVHERLISKEKTENILDLSKELQDRIWNLRNEFTTYTAFCDLVKTKNLNHSRIRRALVHMVLSLTESDLMKLKETEFVPYIRVLGFGPIGATLLKSIKANTVKPLFVSFGEVAKAMSGPSYDLLQKDLFAADVYRILLTQKTGKTFPTEYTRKFGENLL